MSAENYVAANDKFYHFILLAKDEIGHEQIRELSKKGSSNSETIKEQDTQSETVSIADSSKYEGMVIILQKQLIENDDEFDEFTQRIVKHEETKTEKPRRDIAASWF